MKRVLLVLTLFPFFLAKAITLDEVIQTALTNNPVLKQKELDVKIQEKRVKQSRADRFGEIDIFGAFNRYEDKRILYPISPPIKPPSIVGAENQTILGVSYTVPLFTGFRLENRIKINQLGKVLKEIQYRLTKNQIIYNIKSVYIKILSLQKQKEAFLEYKKSLKKLYENVEEEVKVGKKAEVDLLKVEYDLKNVEATIEKIKNSIKSLKQALKTLSGREDLDLSNLKEIKFSKVPELKSIKSLDRFKQTQILSSIYRKKINIAKGLYYPQLFLKVSAQRNMGNDEYKDLWQISFNVKYDLFDFGKRKNQYLETVLEEKKSLLKQKDVKLKIKQYITEALNQIKTAEAQIKASKKQLELSKTVEDIEKTKYEEGISDIYHYLLAKSKKYLAESSYYKALYDKELAVSYLKYILEEYKNE